MSHSIYQHLAYNLAKQLPKKNVALVVTPDALWAQYLYQMLKFWLNSSENLYWFSDWETLPYDPYPPHPDLVSERLRVLAELPTRQNGILITSAAALSQRLCPQTHLDKYGIHLSIGDILPQKDLVERLIQAGYQNNPIIKEKGEYGVRGNVLDLFPMGASDPIRLEWLDDEIDTIRTFAIDTHLTISKLSRISLLPAREIDLSDAGRTCFRQSARAQLGAKIENSGIYESVSSNRPTQGLEYYLPLFFDETATLFDYLPKNTVLIPTESPEAALEQHVDYCQKRYQRLNTLREQTLLSPDKLWLSAESTLNALNALPTHNIKNHCEPLLLEGDADAREAQWLDTIQNHSHVALHFSGNGIREHWFERLHKANRSAEIAEHYQPLSDARLLLYRSPLQYNFQADGIVHLAENTLQSTPETPNYRQTRQKHAGELIQSLQDLHIGDPVVHIDYGVGRYQGLETIGDEEMLAIEYAKSAKLYVAITDLDLINKYSGGSPENAPLHELGGKVWQNAKRKIKQSVNDTAAELLAIYAAREAAEGHAINIDHPALIDLHNSFHYEETPDQKSAINAVLHDLSIARPMDRIVCGDVGFGKTEVAIRAAYATVLAGQQVALIAPTTLLADQHYHNFADRFAELAVQIDSISRFKTSAEQKHSLEQLKNGQTDIIIGTHRLLQKDVTFHNLGLVIIDEEQRFGVRHKEKLKNLRTDVNLLTLTATPIPRTLNLALTGLRDLSIIATPPAGRQSVQTILCDWDLATIEEACRRELSRGGQIFFLHNDVASIDRIARTLQECLPDVRIAVAHGQMRERELETIMQAFYNRHYDILIATTIIESGIDIPNANTILINRADKLGLAQLHQLRGRVGRSHHQAYAYLITPALSTLNKDAQRRLDAFTTLDSLGAGFLLASQDLEIRGAGEILGDEQSGQIQQIGMSYYLDLLDRATAAIKRGEMLNPEADDPSPIEIDLGEPTLLPADYIHDPQLRLDFYQRLARAKNTTTLRELQIELIDRFGTLPEPAKALLETTRLKQRATQIGIEKITLSPTAIDIQFQADAAIEPDKLFALLQNEPHHYKMLSPTSISLRQKMLTLSDRLAHLHQFLDSICK
ncbi:Transcription-repair-coupling factor [Suttonella ornithocola]|uniref:Transcription-repair-coupling factor n=2 Tax=Suttonella ornithocola TaxID=279832 RepID=A0A380MWT9_9GAMM|nr:Transcription-repair-coupling factor [Suttonella ornithocola]